MREFDTAPAYGDSETTLGIALRAGREAAGGEEIKIHTKIAGTEPARFPTPDWSLVVA